MATRSRKAELATMEATHPSFATLSDLQNEKSRPNSSMSVRGAPARILPWEIPPAAEVRRGSG